MLLQLNRTSRSTSAAIRSLRILAAVIISLFIVSFSNPCDDCVTVNLNKGENVLDITIEGNFSGKDQITIQDFSGNIVLQQEFSYQNERTILNIDLYSTEIEPGQYFLSVNGKGKKVEFTIDQ